MSDRAQNTASTTEWVSEYLDHLADIVEGRVTPLVDEELETLDTLRSRMERMEDALRFYADPMHHAWRKGENADGERFTHASSVVDEDAGARATEALI